jgi:predicted nucleic acid-binding protein
MEVWAEYDARIPRLLAEEKPGTNARPILDWLLTVAQFVQPAPLGKPRSRDLKDDRYLACALGADAKFLVSNDRDLLDLEKPFGVAVVTPMQFLLHVRARAGL